jgi:hypothetical protein
MEKTRNLLMSHLLLYFLLNSTLKFKMMMTKMGIKELEQKRR